jgi:hypothetical protein
LNFHRQLPRRRRDEVAAYKTRNFNADPTECNPRLARGILVD